MSDQSRKDIIKKIKQLDGKTFDAKLHNEIWEKLPFEAAELMHDYHSKLFPTQLNEHLRKIFDSL